MTKSQHTSLPNLIRKTLEHKDPQIAEAIAKELTSQRESLKLIASENYCSLDVQSAMATCLTDKYAEGFSGKRFYAGCEHIDTVESIAQSRCQELFGADYAFVQPHCGADANLLAFHAILTAKIQTPFLGNSGEKIQQLSDSSFEKLRHDLNEQSLLAMSLDAGGHLTHGYRMNLSARMFKAHHYGLNEQMLIDYDQIREKAKKVRPLILLAGFSAYTRRIDFEIMRSIADEVGAVLMGDIAHFAGLVAGKQFSDRENPVLHCDIVTSTTHKTLRGPRGGIVLCKKWLEPYVQRACPLMMGGPLPHVMAAKAIAFAEAQSESFANYSAKVIENARALAGGLKEQGISLVTGGTDNHMVLIDLRNNTTSGLQAERALSALGITTNRNALFKDERGPWHTSGIRIGSAALTTRGMGTSEMQEIASMIAEVIKELDRGNTAISLTLSQKVEATVKELTDRFALYPEIEG